MPIDSASVHDQNEPPRSSRSRRQGEVVLIKKTTKNPARQKTIKTQTAALAEPLMNSPSTNADLEVRITEGAYELFHRRGGHHGQDLDD